jgi:hypothetical protein
MISSRCSGDWEANGFDSIGIYRASNQTWFLSNNSTPDGITFSDLSVVWDISTTAPVVGDWNGDNATDIGYLTSSGVVVLRSIAGEPYNLFIFGPTGSKPVAGKWVAPSRPSLGNVINPVTGGVTNGDNGDGSGD